LIKLSVTPETGVFVTDIDDGGVTVKTPSGNQRIAARTVIWAAGVKPSPFGDVLERRAGAPRDKRGQVIVNGDCSLPGHPEIFVIGDLAHLAGC
jgi:NADH dehydrogenase